MQTKPKNYADCYLYGRSNYEKPIYEFFIKSNIIDKNSEAFEDIKYDVKRLQQSIYLTQTLESDNVILLYHTVALPRAFKVFAAKDLKSGDKQLKIFIDMSDIISTKTGRITIHPSNMDKFISYLTSAMMMRIYYSYPEKLTDRSKLVDSGTYCFSELFYHVIDYLRISGADKLREKTVYIASMYYQLNILGKEYSPSVETRCKSFSKINTKDIEILNLQLGKDTYNNINELIISLSKVLNANGLRLENFLDRWLKLYGAGTQFALEYYPAFSTMITNVYNGSYLVTGQKIVEKICGRTLVDYTNTLFSVASEFK